MNKRQTTRSPGIHQFPAELPKIGRLSRWRLVSEDSQTTSFEFVTVCPEPSVVSKQPESHLLTAHCGVVTICCEGKESMNGNDIRDLESACEKALRPIVERSFGTTEKADHILHFMAKAAVTVLEAVAIGDEE